MISQNQNNGLGLKHSMKPQSSKNLNKSLLELPKIQGSFRNLSSSAASTRRSSNMSVSAFVSQQNVIDGTESADYLDCDLSMLQ